MNDKTPKGVNTELADWIRGHNCVESTKALVVSDLVEHASNAMPIAIKSKSARSGLVSEVRATAECLGPRTSTLIRHQCDDLIASLRRDRTQEAFSLLQRLGNTLQSPSFVNAAYEDLVDAVRTVTETPIATEWRRDVVSELCRHQGRSWDLRSSLAGRVLQGHADDIEAAQRVLSKSTRLDDFGQTQNAPLAEDQLDLCKRLVLAETTPAHHVVWLAVDHARLNRFPSFKVGNIEFFHADILRSWIIEKHEGLPTELLNSTWQVETSMPSGPETLFARVDLGIVTSADPINDARRAARGLLGVAKLEVDLSGRTAWRVLSGYWQAVDGELSGFEVIENRDDLAVYREAYEAVGHELEAIAAEGAGVPAALRDDVDSLIRWIDRATGADAAMATVLYVRVIETLAGRAGYSDWEAFADECLMTSWIRGQVARAVIATVRRSIGVLGRMSLNLDPKLGAELDEIARTVFRSLPGLRYEVRFEEAAASLEIIHRAAPKNSAFRREVEYLTRRLGNVQVRSQWLLGLESSWRLLRGRLNEIRNEISHAEAPSDRVVETVVGLASFGARRLTLELVAAGKGNRPFRDSCLSTNTDSRDWLDGFVAGIVPAATGQSQS